MSLLQTQSEGSNYGTYLVEKPTKIGMGHIPLENTLPKPPQTSNQPQTLRFSVNELHHKNSAWILSDISPGFIKHGNGKSPIYRGFPRQPPLMTPVGTSSVGSTGKIPSEYLYSYLILSPLNPNKTSIYKDFFYIFFHDLLKSIYILYMISLYIYYIYMISLYIYDIYNIGTQNITNRLFHMFSSSTSHLQSAAAVALAQGSAREA